MARSSVFDKLLKRYDYALPAELIANEPASPRDSARLLIFDRKQNRMRFDRFSHIANYLPSHALIVFNKTKVMPARLVLSKETGGMVSVLYLGHEKKEIRVLANRELQPGMRLSLPFGDAFLVLRKDKGQYVFEPLFPIRTIGTVLEKYGKTPIPPYIKKSPLSERELRSRYQSTFARIKGSVAAPTASLHFTRKLIRHLEKKGFGIVYVALHINIGTFAPLREDQLATRALHEEHYEIDKRTAKLINRAKQEGRPIIAVGTTVVRTLESAADQTGRIQAGKHGTRLFVHEGYTFKIIDGMITNFHVPKSSLLMLVAAFIGLDQLFKLYRRAIRKKFRFFSFGDGMMIY